MLALLFLFKVWFNVLQVLIQTRIEHLRGKVEESQTINHHGKKLDVEGGKVVNISEVGGGHADEVTTVVPFNQ